MKENQKQIIESYIRSYNDFDIDGMTQHMHKDVVFENMSGGNVDVRTEGLAAFKKQAEAAKHYFTQRKQTIKSWEFTENVVTIHIGYEAVLAIDLPNGMKAGDPLQLKGKSDFEFREGKISRITDQS